MNALQIFQQNFNIRVDPTPTQDVINDETVVLPVENEVHDISVSVPEIPAPEIPVPEIPVPETPVPETPVPEPKTSTTVTITKVNPTAIPEVVKSAGDIVTLPNETTNPSATRRVQRRSSKLAIFRFWGASRHSNSSHNTIPPVPVPAIQKPVVLETKPADQTGGLKVISLVPTTYNLQPLRLRLLLQTQRTLTDKNFILEVDPAAPLSGFDINLGLLSLPGWPADLHFNQLKITEMLRKPHMKRVYGNLNGSTPKQISLRNYDSLTFL